MRDKLLRKVLLIGLLPVVSLLQACVGSVPLHFASITSIAVTGKGMSDHAISAASDRDCSMFNMLKNEPLCRGVDSAEMLLLTSGQKIDDQLLAHQQL